MKANLLSRNFVVAGKRNERRGAMVKTTRVALMALVGLALGTCPFGTLSPARALTTSDQAAAIVIWPKIVVDTSGRFGAPSDTWIQLSNTDTSDAKAAHCFYVNGNSHCANHPSVVCQSSENCQFGNQFDACVPGWSEVDFDVILTFQQPLGWRASEGLQRGCPDDGPSVGFSGTCAAPGYLPIQLSGQCTNPPIAGRPCSSDAQCGGAPGSCKISQSNLGSGIPPVPEDPFVGSLECIQYTVTNPPLLDQTVGSNKLKGEATIVEIGGGPGVLVDPAKYNAVGIKFKGTEAGVPANELHLDDVQYASCPNTLVLPFFFEGGVTDVGELTLVPCGNDYLDQIPGKVTAQFVVFNEFEQRFSTSRLVDCFLESRLGNIDTPNPDRSIFSINVGGTLEGLARIRGVGSASTGRGLTGVARTGDALERSITTAPTNRIVYPSFGSAAYNLSQDGSPSFTGANAVNPDVITLP
jgi:hypothetical protein